MPLMNSILHYALYPFTRTAKLLIPKKAPKKDPPKEEKKDKPPEKAATPPPPDENYIHNASELEVTMRGHTYKVRLMRPAYDTPIPDLLESLESNRDLLAKSEGAMFDTYVAMIKQNKARNAAVKAKTADAIKNKWSAVDLKKWEEIKLRPPTQNALVARANIDLLIPLINVRGTMTEYVGLEANPITDHISRIRAMEEGRACKEQIKKPAKPPTDEWDMREYWIALSVIIIVAILLKMFL